MSELASVEIRQSPERVVVAIRGEIDLSNAPGLGRQLDDAIADHHGEVVIDLSEVGYLDSQALHLLAGLARRPELDIVVVAPAGGIAHELLTLTDLASHMKIRDTIDPG